MVAQGLLSSIMLIVGLGIGGLLGYVLSRFWSRLTGGFATYLQNVLARGRVLAIVDDLAEDRTEIIPLVPLRKGVYVSVLREYPLIVLAPPTVNVKHSVTLGKPVIHAVAFKLYGMGVDMRKLASLGLAKIGIAIREFECTENVRDCIDKLIQGLANIAREGATREVIISPEVRLAITYDVPGVIKNLIASIGDMASTVSTQIKEVSSLALELLRYAQRAGLLGALEKYGWMRWLIPLAVVLIIALFLFMFLPGLLPMPVHPH